ncbi:MAG: hypothetical protein M1820_008034, partial [Bogoriella megaspora]
MSGGPPHGPPGSDPNFDISARLAVTTWAVTALGTFFLALRLYTRAALVKKVAVDDYLLVVA